MNLCCWFFFLIFFVVVVVVFQWLPYLWYFQLIYLVYRWVLVFYFLGWLIASGVIAGDATYFTFLTNWSFLVFNGYLIIAALAVTAKYISVHLIWKVSKEEISQRPQIRTKPLAGCCGCKENGISWYQKVQWLFYLLATESAFLVMITYWGLLYEGGRVSAVSFHTHLINGILSLADAWICGVPTNTLHLIYVMTFGLCYVIFTSIYFAGSGITLYSVLDYENSVGPAVRTIVILILVVTPTVHLAVFYFSSKLKELISYYIIVKGCKERAEDNND